jgi:hypothetical protein
MYGTVSTSDYTESIKEFAYGRSLFEVRDWRLLGERMKEPGKSEVRTIGVPTKIRTQRLQNVSTDPYRYTKLLCEERMRSFSDPNEPPVAKFARYKPDKSSAHHQPIFLPLEVRLNYLSIYI